jgi:hypothetical protein
MFDRLKRTVVESYVGAIALGYLLAECVLHFVNIFASPVAGWISRTEYRNILQKGGELAGFSFRDALPELVRFLVALLVWYVLLRWLYFKPLKAEVQEPPISPDQSA